MADWKRSTSFKRRAESCCSEGPPPPRAMAELRRAEVHASLMQACSSAGSVSQ